MASTSASVVASPICTEIPPNILSGFLKVRNRPLTAYATEKGAKEVSTTGHRDGDPDKTKEEYDADNHADQENPNNDEYDK